MPSAIAALLATVGGKVAVATAVATATVGGLHAADVVDVPILPSSQESASTEETAGVEEHEGGVETSDAHGDDLPEEAQAGQATAAAKQEAARNYTDAVRAWTDCVSEHASARGDSEEHEEPFDPHEACGEHPSPHDFGLTGPPDQASEQGRANSEAGGTRGKPDTVPAGDGAGEETGVESDSETETETETESEPESETESGPPEGAGSQGEGRGRPGS